MSASPEGETKPRDSGLEAAQKLISAIQAGDAQGVLDAMKSLNQEPDAE